MTKRNLPVERGPWLSFLLTGVSLAIFSLGETAFDHLVWREDWARTGEFWRAFTGAFTHLDRSHFVWDVLAFLTLALCVERRGRRLLLGTVVGTLLWTELFLRFSGRFTTYCGLSGIDLGLLVVLGICLFREGKLGSDRVKSVFGLLAIGLAGAKIAYESWFAESVFVDLGSAYSVAVEAHLAGLAAALLVVILGRLKWSLLEVRPLPEAM
ncbi:rhombosortase [Pelagicoccus albus]|uniref:Rhombosortase n=1 Tax=Pelagicoccus albus TaxID=415222 RepID=A0A7X1E924_9BACT|nr:rhombosortase [Pelagicoccus albus]MBC2606979.1 rhombosortase [Pelagicoccus albus]